jgi:hypothetical protein
VTALGCLRYLLSCVRFAFMWYWTRQVVAMLRARRDVLSVRVRPSGDPAVDARIDVNLVQPVKVIKLTLDIRPSGDAL